MSLLRSAIDKQAEQTTFHVTQSNKLVTEFWQDYWNFILDHAPEFQMRKPGIGGTSVQRGKELLKFIGNKQK